MLLFQTYNKLKLEYAQLQPGVYTKLYLTINLKFSEQTISLVKDDGYRADRVDKTIYGRH